MNNENDTVNNRRLTAQQLKNNGRMTEERLENNWRTTEERRKIKLKIELKNGDLTDDMQSISLPTAWLPSIVCYDSRRVALFKTGLS